MTGRHVVLAPLLLLLSLAPLARAHAQAAATTSEEAGLSGDEEARMRFELGRRYYDTGRFEDAAREFSEAHRLSGRAELLYNLFLAYRDAGDDVHAVETLRAYLPTLEAGERRTQLEARLRILEQRLAGGGDPGTDGGEAGEGDPDGGQGGGDGTGEVTPPAAEASGGGGGLGVIPWVVIGVGGALIVGSVITGVLALDARSSLERMCAADGSCPPGFEDTQSNGQALAITTDVLWITGALAAGTGVVLAILDMTSGSSTSDHATLGGACTADGCFASLQGRF